MTPAIRAEFMNSARNRTRRRTTSLRTYNHAVDTPYPSIDKIVTEPLAVVKTVKDLVPMAHDGLPAWNFRARHTGQLNV